SAAAHFAPASSGAEHRKKGGTVSPHCTANKQLGAAHFVEVDFCDPRGMIRYRWRRASGVTPSPTARIVRNFGGAPPPSSRAEDLLGRPVAHPPPFDTPYRASQESQCVPFATRRGGIKMDAHRYRIEPAPHGQIGWLVMKDEKILL